MAYNYRVTKSSVSMIFKETCSAIWEALHAEFLPPPTKEKFKEVAKEYWEMWNFSNCLGAIDGKHVEIVAPPNTGSLFFNYKNVSQSF